MSNGHDLTNAEKHKSYIHIGDIKGASKRTLIMRAVENIT